jgi:hypothetical protein
MKYHKLFTVCVGYGTENFDFSESKLVAEF